MGGGLPLYHVERRVRETGLDFADGAHIMVYFCSKLRRLTSLRGIPVTAAIFSKEFSPDFSMWSITSRRLSLRPSWSPSRRPSLRSNA